MNLRSKCRKMVCFWKICKLEFYDSPIYFFFRKIPCSVLLFYTVWLLDSENVVENLNAAADVWLYQLNCGFHKKSFILNATLVSCPFPSSLLGGCNSKLTQKWGWKWATDQSCIQNKWLLWNPYFRSLDFFVAWWIKCCSRRRISIRQFVLKTRSTTGAAALQILEFHHCIGSTPPRQSYFWPKFN